MSLKRYLGKRIIQCLFLIPYLHENSNHFREGVKKRPFWESFSSFRFIIQFNIQSEILIYKLYCHCCKQNCLFVEFYQSVQRLPNQICKCLLQVWRPKYCNFVFLEVQSSKLALECRVNPVKYAFNFKPDVRSTDSVLARTTFASILFY